MSEKIDWHPNGTSGPWSFGDSYTVFAGNADIADVLTSPSDGRAIAEVPAMVQALRTLTSAFDGGERVGDASKAIADMRAILSRIDAA